MLPRCGATAARSAGADPPRGCPPESSSLACPDPETLRTLCERTGGTFLELPRARMLASQFPGGEERREPISSRLEDAWDTWKTLAAALGLLAAEWILRKRSELL